MERPLLTRRLSAAEFARWYWLKTELVAFCRELRISGAGSKPEINARISASLAGASAPARAQRRVRGQMPFTFRTETLIGAGWSCNPALGAFFRAQCGKTFRFNAAMRTFIHTQEGQPLSAAIDCYRASVAPRAPRRARLWLHGTCDDRGRRTDARAALTALRVVAVWCWRLL